MHGYRKIMTLIDISENGERVARRAHSMARLHNSALAAATIVDYESGYEDHGLLTPGQTCDALVKQFTMRLNHLLGRIDASGTEAIVAAGQLKSSVMDVLQSWQPDLVIVGSHEPYGLDQPKTLFGRHASSLPFDILVVQIATPQPIVGRLVHALSNAFC